MANKRNIEIQDYEGNIYNPHTAAKVVFLEDGKNVESQLAQMATKIEETFKEIGDVPENADVLGLKIGVYRCIGKNYINMPPGYQNAWGMIMVYRCIDWINIDFISTTGIRWHRGNDGWKNISLEGHTHDDRYYTEGEVNNLLNGKAPGGHGLGTTCAPVPNMDCNQILTTGWYMGCNLANAPNADWYMIQNVVHHEGWIVQWAFSFASNPLCWYRLKSNGVWGPWVAYAKPIDGMTRARKQIFSTVAPSGTDWDVWLQHE